MNETILRCENSPEGIFTAVYTAYEKKLDPAVTHIETEEEANYRLFAVYMEVETSGWKAQKVERSLGKRLGQRAAQAIWYAVLSEDAGRADAVYHTIALGLERRGPGSVMDCLQEPAVNRVEKLALTVRNEAHHYMGFLRFSRLESGIMYSEIEPKNQVLVLLGEHFQDRFGEEDFLILDKRRKQYLVHRKGQSYFLYESGEDFPMGPVETAKGEEEIRELFRLFVKTIAIDERENKALQRQLLPLRFRPNMIDFQ